MKRRTFVKTMGQAAAAVSLPQIWSSCKTTNKPRPNVLWIVVEDLSPLMSCYGYDINLTPHLDRLAADGVLFSNTFMPAPVCSACRSAMITGKMQTTLGIHNHHSSRSEETAIHLPENIKTLPELFRQAGYFTFNRGKDDYNFWYDRESLYAGEYTTHALYGKSGKKKYRLERPAVGFAFFWTDPARGRQTHLPGKLQGTGATTGGQAGF